MEADSGPTYLSTTTIGDSVFVAILRPFHIINAPDRTMAKLRACSRT